MAWGDWILAPRPGSQAQLPRQGTKGMHQPNPQGRSDGDSASDADLKDDASSPLKASGGTMVEGDRLRKRLTYDDPMASSRERLALGGPSIAGKDQLELLDHDSNGEERDEEDASSQDSKRSAHAISALAKNFSRAGGKTLSFLRHGWNPPSAGLYKLNVDACSNTDAGTGSSGTVVRDDKGTFMAALCSDIPFAEDAGSAKARGLRDGLLLANELGLEQLVVECDAMEVVDTMCDEGNSLGPAAAIYEECAFLAKNFSFIQFQFCPREANMVADTLARNVVTTRTIKWFEEPPGFLVDVLANDVTLLSYEI
ncbi:hypothetical protein D1007_57566 [Hordeum vulgare]|nr:hypothetical protein D1007_57566 [Hordeum vulgare]